MNSGISIKSLTSKLNSALKLCYSTSRNKVFEHKFFPTTFNVLKESGNLSGNLSQNSTLRYDFDPSNLYKTGEEKLCAVVPKLDLPITRKIIEQGPGIKIKIQVPLKNIRIRELDLPCDHVTDMIEPTHKIIKKEAKNIIKIRREKIKKHKKRKLKKRMKFELRKRMQIKSMKREVNFQNVLKGFIEEGKKFSAEEYVISTLNRINEEVPVTKVRGFIAPPEVVKEYVDNKKYEEVIQKRVEECINYKK